MMPGFAPKFYVTVAMCVFSAMMLNVLLTVLMEAWSEMEGIRKRSEIFKVFRHFHMACVK